MRILKAISASTSRSLNAAGILFLLLAPLALGAQGPTIRGRVTDPQGGMVAGARVTIYVRDGSWRLVATTDATGAYSLETPPAVEYLAEAEAPGLARSATRTIRAGANGQVAADFQLGLGVVAENIVVTASGMPQPVEEVSKSVSILSNRQMEARAESSLVEALRSVPGLRVQQLGGPGSLATIKTRGLPNEHTAVLIDGFRFRDAASPQGDAISFLGDLFATNLDRVEVLHGAGSSLYGTHAVGGTVNIVTAEGGGPLAGSALVEGGMLGTVRVKAKVSGSAAGDRVAFSAGVGHWNVLSGVDDDDNARNTGGQGSLRWRLSSSATLSGRLYASRSFVKTNSGPQTAGSLPPSGVIKAVPVAEDALRLYENGTPVARLNLQSATFLPSANDPDNSNFAHFISAAVRLSHRPAQKFGYAVSYQSLVTDRSIRNGPLGVSFQPSLLTRTDLGGRIHTMALEGNWQGNLNVVNGGYEFESETFVNRSFPGRPAENSTVDVTERSHALFAQDQLRLWEDRLQIVVGFRTQRFSLRRPKLSPQALAPYSGLTFQAPQQAHTGDGAIAYLARSTGTKFRAHVGNGYRAPSLYERFGTAFSSFGYSAFGDPRLKPERSIAVDAGLDQTLADGRLRASATYFYTRLQEVVIFDFSGGIDPATDPFGRFGGYRNAGGGLARGLEFSVTATGRGGELVLGYAYTNSDLRRPVVPGIVRAFAIPDHQFSFVATQPVGTRFSVTFALTATSSYLAPIFDSGTFATRAYEFDGMAKGDLALHYSVPVTDRARIRFYGKVSNLFNQEYYEAGYRAARIGGIGGMQVEF